MASAANIVVFDGSSTPVSHTIVPIGQEKTPDLGAVALWREMIATIPQMANVRVSTFTKKLKSGIERVELRVEMPIMEQANNANALGYTAPPKIAHIPQLSIVGFFNERCTEEERLRIKQLLANLLANISTTVSPVNTGPVADLFCRSITVS